MRPALFLCLLAAAGCVRFQYTRFSFDEPVPAERVDALSPGDGLDRCLDLLGPPRFVWKDPRGVWLAWIWIHERGPSFGVSVPTEGLLPSPGITYSDTKRRGTGVVANLDDRLNLRFVRRGLTDLPPDEP